jgi:hypothetical protein
MRDIIKNGGIKASESKGGVSIGAEEVQGTGDLINKKAGW